MLGRLYSFTPEQHAAWLAAIKAIELIQIAGKGG